MRRPFPSRSWTHRSLANTSIVGSGAPPPFRRIGQLPGTPPAAIVTERGIVAGTKTEIGLHTHDLTSQLWRLPLPGIHELVVFDGKVFLGPVDGDILVIDVASGELLSRIPYEGAGQVKSVTPYGVLIGSASGLALIDFDSGRKAWSRPCKFSDAACDDDAAFLRLGPHDEVACVDLKTGEERWLFRAEPEGVDPTQSHVVHDYGVVADAVVVVTRVGRIHKLDRRTGRSIATSMPQVSGMPLVTENSVFLFRPDALLELRVSDMTDTILTDLTTASKVHKPFSAAASYALSEHAIVWTTVSGAVRAISRRDPAVTCRTTCPRHCSQRRGPQSSGTSTFT
jgi:hypothetical protein